MKVSYIISYLIYTDLRIRSIQYRFEIRRGHVKMALLKYGFLLVLIYSTEGEENEISKAMLLHEVIPDLLDEGPRETLKVTFGNGVTVNKGNELTPTQVQNEPNVEWEAGEGVFYTLLMTEPDAPSRNDLTMREWQHWLVVNIPGNNITKGTILSEYQGSGPDQGTGLHRYVYLLFKQPKAIQFDETYSAATSTKGRPHFSTRRFIKKYDLGIPIAGNFYEAQYDEYSDVILRLLGLKTK
ncbi:protein D3-like [Haematobia irritans]|uniref:protein D3-like n=1 Tax=Haematobia irritans TaxID=7368 RepID=UPI003F4FBFEB